MHKNLNKKLLIPSAISLVFVIVQLGISLNEQFTQDKIMSSYPDKRLDYSPVSIYNGTLFTSCDKFIPDVYFFFLPFIISIPSVLILFNNNIYASNDVVKKLKESFFSGLVCTYIISLENYILSSMFLPAYKPELFTGYFPIIDATFGEIYYYHPNIYLLLFTMIDMLFFGVMSAFFSTVARLCSYSIEAFFMPLLVSFVLYFFGRLYPKIDYYIPTNHLRPSQSVYNLNINIVIIEILFMVAFIVIVNGAIYIIGRGKNDV